MLVIEMNDGRTMKFELDSEHAPITTANFRKLAEEHFFDGLIFHRIIRGFMIQGGDPTGTGMGGSKETIKGEFAANGVDNPIRHFRGTISMARDSRPNSASSQFFICHQDAPHLDGSYAAFGNMTEGWEVLDDLASVATDFRDRPLDPPVIRTIYFED